MGRAGILIAAAVLTACSLVTYQTVEFPRGAFVEQWEALKPKAFALLDRARSTCVKNPAPACREVAAFTKDVVSLEEDLQVEILTDSPAGPRIVFRREPFLARYVKLHRGASTLVRMGRQACTEQKLPGVFCRDLEGVVEEAAAADAEIRLALANPGRAIDPQKVLQLVDLGIKVGEKVADVIL